MSKEKVWIASKYANQITYRRLSKMDERYPRGTFHASWEDAHATIVAARMKELEDARKALRRADANLKRAQKMIAPAIAQKGTSDGN